MAEQTTSSILIDAPADEVMAVIADFERYPEWVQGMKQVEILESDAQGRGKLVHFDLDATPIKDSYTLDYDWSRPNALSWTLTEGKMLRALNGTYTLAEQGDSTEVNYKLAVDVAIPMIGMLKRKAEKVIIDTALKGLKKRVESR